MSTRKEMLEIARAVRRAAEERQRRADARRRAFVRLGTAVALAAAVTAAVVFASGAGVNSAPGTVAAPAGNLSSQAHESQARFAGIPQRGDRLGKAKAPTLVAFADPQCPYCAEYERAVLPAIVRDYVRTGRLGYQLNLRSFLGKDSKRAAAAAAVAAQDGKFFEFTDLLMRNQGPENSGYVSDDFLSGIASATGLPPRPIVKAAADPAQVPAVVKAERQATELGSSGTPDFYLRLASGRMVRLNPDGLTPETFLPALDRALSKHGRRR